MRNSTSPTCRIPAELRPNRWREALVHQALSGLNDFKTACERRDHISFDPQQDLFFGLIQWNTWEARDLKEGFSPENADGEVKPRLYEDSDFEFNEVDYMLCRLARALYGSNWRSKGDQLFRVWFGIDFRGSKYTVKPPKWLANIHVHFVICFPPSMRSKVRSVWPTFFSKEKSRGRIAIDKLSVVPYRSKRGRIDGMYHYAFKGAGLLAQDRGWFSSELYREYPNPNGLSFNYPPDASQDRKVFYDCVRTGSGKSRRQEVAAWDERVKRWREFGERHR